MFGLINLFSVYDFFETTTILWLRFLSFIALIVGIGISVWIENGWIKMIGYGLAGIGILGLLIYLLFGNYFDQAVDHSCVFCPYTPLKLQIQGAPVSLPTTFSLPSNNPYSNTIIYYFVIDKLNGNPGTKDSLRLMTKPNHYDILLDPSTGNFGLMSVEKRVTVGKLPTQGLVQIAITQEQKHFVVFVNGKRTGSLETPELPPTLSISSIPLFNPDSIVSDGILYHLEVHSGTLDVEEIKRRYETVMIQYTNDVAYQGTSLPSNGGMSIAQRFTGFLRMLSGLFGYNVGVNTAISSLNNGT